MTGMLAREWVLAAEFHDPADYDIPEAPVFPATECAAGALALRDPHSGDVVMTAGAPMRVRR